MKMTSSCYTCHKCITEVPCENWDPNAWHWSCMEKAHKINSAQQVKKCIDQSLNNDQLCKGGFSKAHKG